MSGRLFTYRQGDRSEYLALYLLSSLVTQVPRQEDVGFDLVCSIADQETGFLTFKHQYLVSIKSAGRNASIKMSPAKKWDGGYPAHIHWMFELDLPLLLAVVDRDRSLLYLYSTLPAWFLRYSREYQHCGKLSLVPRVRSRNPDVIRVAPARLEQIKGHPDKFHYSVDLGHPMFAISVEDVSDRERLRTLKQRLRLALRLADATMRYAKAGAPYFYWRLLEIYPCFFLYRHASGSRNSRWGHARHCTHLSTLAMYYKTTNQPEILHAIVNVLKLAPLEAIPKRDQGSLTRDF
jgi:hypothetical protein